MRRYSLIFLFLCLVKHIIGVPIRVARVGDITSFPFLETLNLPNEWKTEVVAHYQELSEIPDSKIMSYDLICLEKGINSFLEKERIRRYLDQGGVIVSSYDVKDCYCISESVLKNPINWNNGKLGNVNVSVIGKGAWIHGSSVSQLNKEEVQVLVNCLDRGGDSKIGLPDSLSLELTLDSPFENMIFYEDKIIAILNGKLGIYHTIQRELSNEHINLASNGFKLIKESSKQIKGSTFIQVCPHTRNIVVGSSDSDSSSLYITPLDSFLNGFSDLQKLESPENEGLLSVDQVFFNEGKMFAFFKKDLKSEANIYIYDFFDSDWVYKIVADKKEKISFSAPGDIKPSYVKFRYIKNSYGGQSSVLGAYYTNLNDSTWELSFYGLAVKSEGPLFPRGNPRSTPPIITLTSDIHFNNDGYIMGCKGSESIWPKIWFENTQKMLQLENFEPIEGTDISFPLQNDTDLSKWKEEHLSATADYWHTQYIPKKTAQRCTSSISSPFITESGIVFLVIDKRYIIAIEEKSEDNDLQVLYQYDLEENSVLGEPVERNGNIVFLIQGTTGVKEILFPSDLRNIELPVKEDHLPANKSIILIQKDAAGDLEFYIRPHMVNAKKDALILNLLSKDGKRPYINKTFEIKNNSDAKNLKIESSLIKQNDLVPFNVAGVPVKIGEDFYFLYKEGNSLKLCINDNNHIIDQNLPLEWEDAKIKRIRRKLILELGKQIKIYSKQKWLGVAEDKDILFWNSYGKGEQEQLFKTLGGVSQVFQHPKKWDEIWALDKTTETLYKHNSNEVIKEFKVDQKVPYWSSQLPRCLNHPVDFQLVDTLKGLRCILIDSELKRVIELQRTGREWVLKKISSPSFLLGHSSESVSINKVMLDNQELWVIGLTGIQSEVFLYDPIKGRSLFIPKIADISFEEIRKVTAYQVVEKGQKQIRFMVTDKNNIYEFSCTVEGFESLFDLKNWSCSWSLDEDNYGSRDFLFATRYSSGEIGVTGRWENKSVEQEGFLLLDKDGKAFKSYFPMIELKSVYPYAY